MAVDQRIANLISHSFQFSLNFVLSYPFLLLHMIMYDPCDCTCLREYIEFLNEMEIVMDLPSSENIK